MAQHSGKRQPTGKLSPDCARFVRGLLTAFGQFHEKMNVGTTGASTVGQRGSGISHHLRLTIQTQMLFFSLSQSLLQCSVFCRQVGEQCYKWPGRLPISCVHVLD